MGPTEAEEMAVLEATLLSAEDMEAVDTAALAAAVVELLLLAAAAVVAAVLGC